MKRADLNRSLSNSDSKSNNAYDGWQVIDATPQEQTFGRFQCGPAPVSAIKQGRIDLGYEAGFIFGEVNADVCFWSVKEEANKKHTVEEMIYKSTSEIGNFISTKSVGSNRRRNVTSSYKHREGSEKEREAFRLAFRLGNGDDKFGTSAESYFNCKKDFSIDVSVENSSGSSPFVGDDLKIKIVINIINQNFHTSAIKYTGGLYSCYSQDKASTSRANLISRIKSEKDVNILDKGRISANTFVHEIKGVDYFSKMHNGNCFKICLAVQEVPSYFKPNTTYGSGNNGKPRIMIKDFKFTLKTNSKETSKDIYTLFIDSDQIKTNEKAHFTISIKNIFQQVLNNCIRE